MLQIPWRFDNTCARLPGSLYSRQTPAAVPAPATIIVNHALAQQLGLDLGLDLDLEGLPDDELIQLFSGNTLWFSRQRLGGGRTTTRYLQHCGAAA